MQSIREICIYKKSPEKWWQYQAKLAECDKACYDDVYSQLGLSQQEIYKCANDSFINGDEMNDNTLLREAKDAAKIFAVKKNQNVFVDVGGIKFRVNFPSGIYIYFIGKIFASQYIGPENMHSLFRQINLLQKHKKHK